MKRTDRSRILVVEDETSLAQLLRINLEQEGHQVDIANEGPEALELFGSRAYELIILDIMLPGMDGSAVCKKIRAENDATPIIFLTAKNEARDRIESLRIGGDDHIGKPFELEELLLRVSRSIERSRKKNSPSSATAMSEFRFGGHRVDFKGFQAHSKDGRIKGLSKREASVLKYLIDNQDRAVSREELLETVWGFEVYPSTRTVDNFILAFRKFFEEDPKHPNFFHSIRGVGYKFTPGEGSGDTEPEE